jgi:hypothetical protein
VTRLNKEGEIEGDVYPDRARPIKPKWVSCPECGARLSGRTVGGENCRCAHCQGTGKCDCHECKCKYWYPVEKKLAFHDDGRYHYEADKWAETHDVVVA